MKFKLLIFIGILVLLVGSFMYYSQDSCTTKTIYRDEESIGFDESKIGQTITGRKALLEKGLIEEVCE